HDPSLIGDLFGAADYPKPIVDLSKSRARALAAFKALPARQPAAGAEHG
ncbi:FAD-binding domain-containing protein, partial [Pseudomonas syringae]